MGAEKHLEELREGATPQRSTEGSTSSIDAMLRSRLVGTLFFSCQFEFEVDPSHVCRLAERAAALEARLATAEAEADSARESLRQTRVENATLQSALQAARAERNALNAAIRSVLAARSSQFIDTL